MFTSCRIFTTFGQIFTAIMKHLLKYLLVIVCSTTCVLSKAQDQQWTWGVQAGLNLSDGVEKADYNLGSNRIKTGFQAGVTAAYSIYNGLQLQSGLAFTTKGVKNTRQEWWIGTGNPPLTTTLTTTNFLYAQIPLKIAYRLNMGEQFTVTPNAGIYFAYGLGGKQILRSSTTNNAMEDRKVTYNSFAEEDGYKRFDNGISFGVTLQFKQYTLAGDYEMGAANIGRNPNEYQKYSFRNRNIGITLGYIF